MRRQKDENGSLCFPHRDDRFGEPIDSLQKKAAVKEEPKPLEADELFDDFIFSYASDVERFFHYLSIAVIR